MSMSIVALYNQIQTTAKSGTSGYQSQAEFNSDIDTIQKRIANVLCDNYDKSQKVEDALFGLIISVTANTNSMGVITTPADYFRLVSVWVNVAGIPTPASKIATNQISAYSTSYIRKPSVADGNYSVYYLDNKIQMMPLILLNCTLAYCKVPPAATIVLTPNSASNSDYLVATVGTDLVWSNVVYNLFYYMMMEMLGIEMKENILYEYAQLGIPKEAYIGMSIKEQGT